MRKPSSRSYEWNESDPHKRLSIPSLVCGRMKGFLGKPTFTRDACLPAFIKLTLGY